MAGWPARSGTLYAARAVGPPPVSLRYGFSAICCEPCQAQHDEWFFALLCPGGCLCLIPHIHPLYVWISREPLAEDNVSAHLRRRASALSLSCPSSLLPDSIQILVLMFLSRDLVRARRSRGPLIESDVSAHRRLSASARSVTRLLGYYPASIRS